MPHLRLVCVTLNANISGGCVHVGLGAEREAWAEGFACFASPNMKWTSVSICNSVQTFAYGCAKSRVVGLGLRCMEVYEFRGSLC